MRIGFEFWFKAKEEKKLIDSDTIYAMLTAVPAMLNQGKHYTGFYPESGEKDAGKV